MLKQLSKEERCPTCKNLTVQAEYKTLCDWCGKNISAPNSTGYGTDKLDASLFKPDMRERELAQRLAFCNWKEFKQWVFKNKHKIGKRKSGGFLAPPYIHKEDIQYL